jgi:hypothetical protein
MSFKLAGQRADRAAAAVRLVQHALQFFLP